MDWLIGGIRGIWLFSAKSPLDIKEWISSGEEAREWGMREITFAVQYIELNRTVCSRELRKRLIR